MTIETTQGPDSSRFTPAQRLGRAGYHAYAVSTGGKTFDGRDMPDWNVLPEGIQKAWTDAATAIVVMHESTLVVVIGQGGGGGGGGP